MKLDVGGTLLFFDVEGTLLERGETDWRNRPTVVLLHPGPGVDHSVYKDLIGPTLAEVAQVVYIDQRGDGRSDRSNASRWNLETWAGDLHELLGALEIEHPILLGSSTGALVALHYTWRHPERASKLVLISAVARYVHARSIAVFDRLGGPAAGEVAAAYFADPNETTLAQYLQVCLPLYSREGFDPDVVARMRMNPEVTAHWDRTESTRIDMREAAASVRCPVLLLAGEDDPSATIGGVEELAEAFPPGLVEFRRYAGARHGVVRDEPRALEDIRRFVVA